MWRTHHASTWQQVHGALLSSPAESDLMVAGKDKVHQYVEESEYVHGFSPVGMVFWQPRAILLGLNLSQPPACARRSFCTRVRQPRVAPPVAHAYRVYPAIEMRDNGG